MGGNEGAAIVSRVPLTYCSFANDDRCLGVVILEGACDNPGLVAVCTRALGLNPGGELLCFVFPDDAPEREYLRHYENRGRLLTPAEARELLAGCSLGELERDSAIDHD